MINPFKKREHNILNDLTTCIRHFKRFDNRQKEKNRF